MRNRLLTFTALLALGGLGCEAGGTGDGVSPVGTQSGAATQAAQAAAASSEPAPAPAADPAGAVSVRLTVRVTRTGGAEIVDAVELPGIIKLEKDMRRDYLYEARDGRGVIAVQAIDVDFEQRPIAKGDPHGESIEVDEQLIHVDLPGVSLEAARNVSLRLSRLAGGHQERIASAATFARLAQQGKLRPFVEVRPGQLAAALATRARRIPRTPASLLGQ
jgi:hypothetical protein